MPANSAAPSANTVDFQNLCGLGMDRAIGIEKASLDIKKKASWFAPLLGYLFNTVTKAFASCMESQRNWLNMRVPCATSHVGTAASNSSSQAQSTPDELAYSMDIAIGERFTAPDRTVASSSGSQTPTAEVPECSMGLAMAARAGG
jgi:hypothetical protein